MKLPVRSDTASLPPVRTFHVEADLTLEEFKLLYKVLWAAQATADTVAVAEILEDTGGISREVTVTTAEIMRAGHTFANVLRKFGLVPEAERKFAEEVANVRGETDPEADRRIEGGGQGREEISFREFDPSEEPRRLEPPAEESGPGEKA